MPKPPPPPSPPPRPADVKRAVLDASLALIEEGGVGALSMREVARRAKVTHGAPYHYFPDRAAILAGLAEEGFELLTREMATAMQKEPTGTLDRFEACGRAYFRFAVRHPAYMRIMFRPELSGPADHPSVDAAAERAMGLLVVCVTECQSAGAMSSEEDPMGIVLTSWATMHGLASLWLDGPLRRLHGWSASPVELARRVTSMLARWLAPRALRSTS
jgi:AcrR family transcriptional regulator